MVLDFRFGRGTHLARARQWPGLTSVASESAAGPGADRLPRHRLARSVGPGATVTGRHPGRGPRLVALHWPDPAVVSAQRAAVACCQYRS